MTKSGRSRVPPFSNYIPKSLLPELQGEEPQTLEGRRTTNIKRSLAGCRFKEDNVCSALSPRPSMAPYSKHGDTQLL